MSVAVPNQRLIFSSGARTGIERILNQRCEPSARRMRASTSNTLPLASEDFKATSKASRSNS